MNYELDMLMKPKLIIFDCDGVLINSEIISHQIGSQEMTKIGFPLTVKRSVELFSGVANADLDSVIFKAYGKPIAREVLDSIIEKVENNIYQNVKAISDIYKVLVYLKQQNINKCIASNSNYEYLARVLATSGLHLYFDQNNIFSAISVARGKPKPDLFLHVAKQFQIKPEECLVVEDSVVGIRAAKAAGMPVIGFLGGEHADNDFYHQCIFKENPSVIAHNAIELLDVVNKLF